MPLPKLMIPTIDNDSMNNDSNYSSYDEGYTDTERSLDSPISIPNHLESVKMKATNYNNFTDGQFGQKFTNDKIKKQFTHLVKGRSTLGIKLMYFKNKTLDTFTKIFIYSKDSYLEPTNILIKILSEVYYHNEFSKLQDSCKFKIPELINYGFIEHNDDASINIRDNMYMFYITMTDIEAIPVTKLNELYNDDEVLDKCMAIEQEVDRIDNCLEKHNLYHNDLHSDNVMVDKNGKITIIDFGEASDVLQKPFFSVDFCGKFKKNKGGTRKRKAGTRKRKSKSKRTRKTRRSKRQKGGVSEAQRNDELLNLIDLNDPDVRLVIANLLEEGVSPVAKNTALHIASRKGYVELVAMLLNNGANVNATDNHGDTALSFASQNGHTETVAMLLAAGADVNIKSDFGGTALMLASLRGHTEIVAKLLEKGADVNAENNYGQTALSLASLNGHTDIVKLIKQHIVAQTLPRHLERQQEKENLAMIMSKKDVGNRGDGTMPYDLRHKIGQYLGGGKRKTRKIQKSKSKHKYIRRMNSKRRTIKRPRGKVSRKKHFHIKRRQTKKK